MPETVEGRLRAEEIPKGSSIWELASQNRDTVKDYVFWEIVREARPDFGRKGGNREIK